jgi:hypothetical protein
MHRVVVPVRQPMYEHPYDIANFTPPSGNMNWASVHLRNKVGREDTNRLVLVWDCGAIKVYFCFELLVFLYQLNFRFRLVEQN